MNINKIQAKKSRSAAASVPERAPFLTKMRGQSPVEYTFLVIIVIAALIGFGAYFRRGIQGRWRDLIDDVGEQYDPLIANSLTRYTARIYSRTEIHAEDADTGIWTSRVDMVNVYENKRRRSHMPSYTTYADFQ